MQCFGHRIISEIDGRQVRHFTVLFEPCASESTESDNIINAPVHIVPAVFVVVQNISGAVESTHIPFPRSNSYTS